MLFFAFFLVCVCYDVFWQFLNKEIIWERIRFARFPLRLRIALISRRIWEVCKDCGGFKKMKKTIGQRITWSFNSFDSRSVYESVGCILFDEATFRFGRVLVSYCVNTLRSPIVTLDWRRLLYIKTSMLAVLSAVSKSGDVSKNRLCFVGYMCIDWTLVPFHTWTISAFGTFSKTQPIPVTLRRSKLLLSFLDDVRSISCHRWRSITIRNYKQGQSLLESIEWQQYRSTASLPVSVQFNRRATRRTFAACWWFQCWDLNDDCGRQVPPALVYVLVWAALPPMSAWNGLRWMFEILSRFSNLVSLIIV